MFASLQSDAAKNILLQYKCKNNKMDSILLVEGGQVYEKSTAALMISRHLRAPWPLLSIGLHLPRSWRDGIYDIIANNRYKWFGKKESCVLMVPEHKNRFI
jgi:predicted DCC family thiol-disulfide oxidoreductase YuxK